MGDRFFVDHSLLEPIDWEIRGFKGAVFQWSDEQRNIFDKRVAELYDRGLSFSQIACYVGCASDEVVGGWRRFQDRPVWTDSDLANLKGNRLYWPESAKQYLEDRLIRMLELGIDPKYMSRKFNISYDVLSHYLTQLRPYVREPERALIRLAPVKIGGEFIEGKLYYVEE